MKATPGGCTGITSRAILPAPANVIEQERQRAERPQQQLEQERQRALAERQRLSGLNSSRARAA